MCAETNTGPNPSGLCMCGCGKRTPFSKKTSTRDNTRKGHPTSFILGHQPMFFRGRSGPLHPTWRGGRFLKEGRWYLRVADDHPMANHQGHVAEYRLVLATALGRMLTRDEHVHHIDLDETNNAVSNLVVLTRSEHGKVHVLIVKGASPLDALRQIVDDA